MKKNYKARANKTSEAELGRKTEERPVMSEKKVAKVIGLGRHRAAENREEVRDDQTVTQKVESSEPKLKVEKVVNKKVESETGVQKVVEEKKIPTDPLCGALCC